MYIVKGKGVALPFQSNVVGPLLKKIYLPHISGVFCFKNLFTNSLTLFMHN